MTEINPPEFWASAPATVSEAKNRERDVVEATRLKHEENARGRHPDETKWSDHGSDGEDYFSFDDYDPAGESDG